MAQSNRCAAKKKNLMKNDILGLYKEYFIDRDFERLDLFETLQEKYQTNSAIYPGSFVHVTPSFVYPVTTYIDSDKKAKKFFNHSKFLEFIAARKQYTKEALVTFYPNDYRKSIDERNEKYDLLISQYAGFVSMYCKKYLKYGGILLANNSHGDAGMASIDEDFELVAVIKKSGGKHRWSDKKLDEYFVPKKEIEITTEYLEKIGKGIGYKKTASSYLFRRVG